MSRSVPCWEAVKRESLDPASTPDAEDSDNLVRPSLPIGDTCREFLQVEHVWSSSLSLSGAEAGV
jgi:hypothetical protein